MPSVTAELIEAKRDTRGRRVWSTEECEKRIAEYRGSGLTQREFALREGLSYGTFVGWLGRRRVRPAGKRRVFREVRLATVPESAAVLEVRLPDGTAIRGRSVAEVAGLVRLLRS